MTAAAASTLTPPLPFALPAPSDARPPKKRLPAGRPREWYVAHNRRLKAMRIAIALLDSGVYTPGQARDHTIRRTAARIGVHPPSSTTCGLVRSLLP
ncbi:hypothetical protein [Streptomyces nanshensis]|uniref:Uncharacterized protein n=1 Tax=Streptomyces nanshensis TaxID=518642 RepID=A0A1E7KYZ9_9ACTN|nr:hypothetical protein [Streptomyces nanshensis]OEV09156.1 hypothetical protein AN218_23330 [Streptomyces nanshensis]